MARRRQFLVVLIIFVATAVAFLVMHEMMMMSRREVGFERGVNAFHRPSDNEDAERRRTIAKLGFDNFLRQRAEQAKANASRATSSNTSLPDSSTVQSAATTGATVTSIVASATASMGASVGATSTHGPLDKMPLVQPDLDEKSIFVSIASYRDEECMPTIVDMYERSKNPKSLYVGIVEQHDHASGDPICVPLALARPAFIPGGTCDAPWCPSDNMRRTIIHPRDAKGPTFGRYHGMLMYRGEKYYMMIDSHNRFVTHWDDVAIRVYKKLPTKKGVLSHYPEAWHNPADKGQQTNAPLDNRPTTTYLCNAKFIDHLGYVRLDGFVVSRRAESRPQPWAAAGFLFADAKLLSEVPFDPHLDYVFDGEEILYSARMWTHGWDIFSPSENIMYHYYYRPNAKKFWGLLPPHWDQRRDAAQRRIQFLLETVHKGSNNRMVAADTQEAAVRVELDKYGLGTVRSLNQWYEFAGIDKVHYKLTKNFCQMHS